MKKFSTKVTFITESDNGDLDDYPKTSKYTLEFDATDLNIYGYAEQMRCFLRAAGFSEGNITEVLGES